MRQPYTPSVPIQIATYGSCGSSSWRRRVRMARKAACGSPSIAVEEIPGGRRTLDTRLEVLACGGRDRHRTVGERVRR